jgi:hypothetical protein
MTYQEKSTLAKHYLDRMVQNLYRMGTVLTLCTP